MRRLPHLINTDDVFGTQSTQAAPAKCPLRGPAASVPFTQEHLLRKQGETPDMRTVRLFISSPGDVDVERRRMERVAARLNGEFAPIAHLETVRWETRFYTAHEGFQPQIPEASKCDLVIAVFWSRLGTELPQEFPKMPDGEPYPSGSAYEVLSALEARKTGTIPDVYVFRKTAEPLVPLSNRESLALAQEQWDRLQRFFERWFRKREGQFLAAFHNFETADEFEDQIERLLRGWLSEHVLLGAHRVSWTVDLKGSPFCGLSAFDADHEAVFFGRGREIARATEQLAAAAKDGTPFLLVVGASGVGKSSFVRAGLVPRLITPGVVGDVDLWRVAVMHPASDPAAAFASALYETDGAGGGLADLAKGDYTTPEAFAALIHRGANAAVAPICRALDRISVSAREREGSARDPRSVLLLVVDQMDELFAENVSAQVRTLFSQMLSALTASGRVWIVGTLRGDLYQDYISEPALLALKQSGVHWDLVPPGAAELAEIVRKPAEAAGLVYDRSPSGERLDDRLLRDARSADVLPMLQFTLQRLFDLREKKDGVIQLTHTAYDSFGGLDGAIDWAAEAAIEKLDRAAVDMLPLLFRKLVGLVHSEGALQADRLCLATRSMAISDFAPGTPGAKLVTALVDARILTTSGEVARVRLAHQRVLESWRRARGLIRENENYYRVAGEVRDQFRRWIESGAESSMLLPRGSLLSSAFAMLSDFGSPIDRAASAFVRASRWRTALSRVHIVMILLIPLQIFLAIAIPNMVGSNDPHGLGGPLFLLPEFVLLIWASWPLVWVGFSWLIHTNSVKALTLAAHTADKRADREGATLKNLVSAMRWQLYGLSLNSVMVVLALPTIFVLLVLDTMHRSDALMRPFEIAVEVAAPLLILVWPILSLYFGWRRRRQSGRFVRELRTQQSRQLLEADTQPV